MNYKAIFGQGAQGYVQKTEIKVKVIESTLVNEYSLQEMVILEKIRHPHVISLMGIGCDEKKLYLVIEYMEGAVDLYFAFFDTLKKESLHLI